MGNGCYYLLCDSTAMSVTAAVYVMAIRLSSLQLVSVNEAASHKLCLSILLLH